MDHSTARPAARALTHHTHARLLYSLSIYIYRIIMIYSPCYPPWNDCEIANLTICLDLAIILGTLRLPTPHLPLIHILTIKSSLFPPHRLPCVAVQNVLVAGGQAGGEQQRWANGGHVGLHGGATLSPVDRKRLASREETRRLVRGQRGRQGRGGRGR